jgi:hypothetical protein
MKNHKLYFFDLFFLLSLVEGIIGLYFLFSIPADPKNSIVLGLSWQRLIIAAVLVSGALLFGGLIIYHNRQRNKFNYLVEKILANKKINQSFHVLFSFGLALGLAGVFWLPSSTIIQPAVLTRIAPMLDWLGLVGGQGMVILFWLDHRQENTDLVTGLRWIVNSFAVFALAAYLTWLVVDPGKAGLFIGSDLGLTQIIAFILFLSVFEHKDWFWKWIGLILAFCLFLIPLLGIWASGVSDLNFVTGLFPFNDAHGYYYGARRILEGSTLHDFAAHRPLFPAFLAFLLGITAQNLQASIFLLVILAAFSSYIFAQEVKRTHGSAAGIIAFLLLFLFYRRFIGSVMTENQGLAMGAAGFAVLWRAVSERKTIWFYIGLACLSIALNARAGPFFILPALVIWAAWFFKKKGWFSWRVLVLGALAAGIGFLGNIFVFKVTASENSAPFSNFSYTLYGTSVGGKGWKQIFVDHPELSNLQEPALSNKVYSLTLEEIKRNPTGLIAGSIAAWKSMFSLDFYGMFGFVNGPDKDAAKAVRLIFFLISLIGLIAAAIKWKNGLNSFVLAAVLGVWFSVPFVPPLDAEIRTYAAVIPLFAILALLGIVEIVRFARKITEKKSESDDEKVDSYQKRELPAWLGAGFAIIFCVAAIFGPVVIKGLARPVNIQNIVCPSGEEAVYVRINPGSYINVVDDNNIRQTWLPNIRWSDFSKSIHDFSFYEITEELDPIAPPTTIAFTYNIKDNRHVWLIADTRSLPGQTGLMSICGNWSKNIEKYGYGFFYGKTVQPAKIVVSEK